MTDTLFPLAPTEVETQGGIPANPPNKAPDPVHSPGRRVHASRAVVTIETATIHGPASQFEMTPQPIASSAVPVANAGRVPLEFLKYFATSVIALAIDAGLLAALTRAGAPYQSAAAAGFLCGLALAYILSVRWVFDVRAVGNGAVEFGAFAMIGFAGLGLTELFLWAAIDKCHIGLALAKACSAGGVFLFNFGVRKALLFRGRG